MPQTWSAYADVVSSDGRRALIVRVSHDPAADRAELWVHAFIDGQMFAHMSAYQCPPLAAPMTGDEHQQIRLDLEAGILSARVDACETDRIDFGVGSIPMTVTLQWTASGLKGSNLRGRHEQFVKVVAHVTIHGKDIEIVGWGHQHTQLQEQPRFAERFTYLSLRGDDINIIALLTGQLQRGFGSCRGVAMKADTVMLDEVAARRRIRIQSPAATLAGVLNRTYHYWIPMGGSWRDGSVVTGDLNGLAVSGVVNDFAGPASS